MLFTRFWVLASALAVAACSGTLSERATGSDAAAGDAGSTDAPIADGADAGACTVGDAARVQCPMSLASLCALDGGAGYAWNPCGTTWSSVTAAPPCAFAGAAGDRVYLASCGATNEVVIGEVDTAIIADYDVATGDLVAVGGIGDPGIYGCSAGPACAPLQCTAIPVQVCLDAGVDASDAGDASD